MRWMRVVAGAVVMLCAADGRANDASFGGEGALLVPLVETRVEMASEDIRLAQVDGAWQVTAHYQFYNPTSKAIALQMGFPESRCEGGSEGCHGEGGTFRDLETRVDGAIVAQRLGQAPKGHHLAAHLGRVFVYDATFPPKRMIPIDHRYRYDRSPGNGEEFIGYVTETGKLWAGPIGRARFTIVVPHKPWSWTVHASGLGVVGVRESARETELVIEGNDWVPERNFVVVMEFVPSVVVQRYGGPDLECAIPFSVFGSPAAGVPERTELDKLSDAELRLCRALVIAHHGGPVPDGLHALIYRGTDLDADDKLGFVPNPAYSEALLSDDEQTYVAMVDALLEARQPRTSAPATAPSGAPAPAPVPQPPGAGCGHCAMGTTRGSGWWLLGVAWLHGIRRRTRQGLRHPPVDRRDDTREEDE